MSIHHAASLVSRIESHQEQYRNPKWIECSREKKRCCPYCECCKRADVRLQTHHLFYDPSLKLWEHEQKDLVVLCESCHGALHEQLKHFRRTVFGKLNGRSFQVLNGALNVGLEEHDALTFAHALAEFVSNPQMLKRYAEAWNKNEKS